MNVYFTISSQNSTEFPFKYPNVDKSSTGEDGYRGTHVRYLFGSLSSMNMRNQCLELVAMTEICLSKNPWGCCSKWSKSFLWADVDSQDSNVCKLTNVVSRRHRLVNTDYTRITRILSQDITFQEGLLACLMWMATSVRHSVHSVSCPTHHLKNARVRGEQTIFMKGDLYQGRSLIFAWLTFSHRKTTSMM